MCVTVCTDVCVPHVCNAHESQKRMLDPLELELQTVMGPYAGHGSLTPDLRHAASVLNLLSHLSSLGTYIVNTCLQSAGDVA